MRSVPEFTPGDTIKRSRVLASSGYTVPVGMRSSAREWRDGRHWLSTRCGSVFVRAAKGVRPTGLLFHGYPSRPHDYSMVVPHLAFRANGNVDLRDVRAEVAEHANAQQAASAHSAVCGAPHSE